MDRAPQRLGSRRGRGKRARGRSRGRGHPQRVEDMSHRDDYRHSPNPQDPSPQRLPRLGRGRGSASRGGGHRRGRVRRVMEPTYANMQPPVNHIQPPINHIQLPRHEMHSFPVNSEPPYYQPGRTSPLDLAANSAQVGMMEPTNLSYSPQASVAMSPMYASHGMSPRVHSPIGHSPMGAPQTFVYSQYRPPSSMHSPSSAAISVLAPRHPGHVLDTLPPQHLRQQIYSTELAPKTYYASTAPTYSTYSAHVQPNPPLENPANYQTYDNHSPLAQNYPIPDNPYTSSPFSADEYGGSRENNYEAEAPASHSWNPYSNMGPAQLNPAAQTFHSNARKPEPGAKKQKVCTFFNSLGCKFGEKCRFLHVKDSTIDPGAKKQKVCTFFNSLGCKSGEKCRFLHVKDSTIDVDFAICWDFNTLRGCSNPGCRWEHRACSKARQHPHEDGVECRPEYGVKHEIRDAEKKENLSDGSDNQTDPPEKSILPPDLGEASDGKEEIESSDGKEGIESEV